MARIRIGLALGSGVARGWAHLGVLKAIDRLGIVPDIVAGSSIGSLVGGFYLAGQVKQLEGWARRLTKLRLLRYLNLRMGGGVISGKKLFHEAERYLGDVDIKNLEAPFVAVATDLRTGHEIWLRDGKLVDAMRASLSLPGVFRPLRMNGHWLIDGALVNPVPVSVCRALGAQMVISVDLNADIMGKHNDGEPRAGGDSENTPNGDNAAAAPMLITSQHPRPGNPGTFEVMVAALNIVQDRIARSRLAGEPPDVSINPRVGHIGLLDFHRADELIELGEVAVERAMPEIRDAITVFASIHG
jgi:NTE family protein